MDEIVISTEAHSLIIKLTQAHNVTPRFLASAVHRFRCARSPEDRQFDDHARLTWLRLFDSLDLSTQQVYVQEARDAL